MLDLQRVWLESGVFTGSPGRCSVDQALARLAGRFAVLGWLGWNLFKNFAQGVDQRLALRVGADGDAQMLIDARQLEVADDDAALA